MVCRSALDIVDTLVKSAAVDMVVVDSVAALVPKAELEGEMGDHHIALQVSQFSMAPQEHEGQIERRSSGRYCAVCYAASYSFENCLETVANRARSIILVSPAFPLFVQPAGRHTVCSTLTTCKCATAVRECGPHHELPHQLKYPVQIMKQEM